jgi:hypothetical protein
MVLLLCFGGCGLAIWWLVVKSYRPPRMKDRLRASGSDGFLPLETPIHLRGLNRKNPTAEQKRAYVEWMLKVREQRLERGDIE